MQDETTRTLRLGTDAYVITCAGDETGTCDAGVRAGLGDLMGRGATFVIVDVLAARLLDQPTVALLFDTCRTLRAKGGDLWLVGADPRLRHELALDGRAASFHLEPTLAGAVAAVMDVGAPPTSV